MRDYKLCDKHCKGCSGGYYDERAAEEHQEKRYCGAGDSRSKIAGGIKDRREGHYREHCVGYVIEEGAQKAALYFFAEEASSVIFRSLKGEELAILSKLIKAFSISTLTLSCAQTLSACLTAQGKPQYAALSMTVSVTVKTAVYVFLLQKPQISVFGLAYASNACYLVAFLLNLLYNLRVAKRKI